jgi:hypothetical protein
VPRHLVERTFPSGLQIPVTEEGAAACLGVVDRAAVDQMGAGSASGGQIEPAAGGMPAAACALCPRHAR